MAIIDTEFRAVQVTEKTDPFGVGKATATRTLDFSVRALDVSDMQALFDAPVSETNRAMFAEYRADRQTTLESHGERAWYGSIEGRPIRTRAEVDGLIANGWPEGAALAKSVTAQLVDVLPPPASIKRRTRWADEGDELDRDKLDRGEVDTMWRTSRRDSFRTAPQTISIAATWGGNCTLSADQLKWGAAAMCALSDVLEEAGYNTELFATRFCMDNLTHVRVKRAGEALAIDSVMALIGHAAVFRTYGIGSIAVQRTRVSYGWGHQKDAEPGTTLAAQLGAIDNVDILLPYIHDKATAERECKRVLAMMDETQAV